MRLSCLSVLALSAAFLFAGCAATPRLVNQWSNPEYAAPEFRRMLVIAVSQQPGIRRTFEDEFVARLRAAGMDAVPSYHYMPEDGKADEARVQAAVKQAGADAAMITRLVRVDKKTEVRPGFYRPAPAVTFGFYPAYSSAWLGYYEPPRIYQYEVYTLETNLYELRKNQLVWSGIVQATRPGEIQREIRSYVEIVVDALRRSQLLRSA